MPGGSFYRITLFLRACHTMANMLKNCDFSNNVTRRIIVQAFSRENSSFNMLDKIINRPHRARADWLNHFHSPWESKGYKVESQNDQLRLT